MDVCDKCPIGGMIQFSGEEDRFGKKATSTTALTLHYWSGVEWIMSSVQLEYPTLRAPYESVAHLTRNCQKIVHRETTAAANDVKALKSFKPKVTHPFHYIPFFFFFSLSL
jgi:hypothetical protein